jgi:glycosyltransferase involved in cell wall biosynthesis
VTDLTVCIPAFDAEGTIERAVRSIADQEVDADVEILVCDDGSTDGTRAVLDRLAGEIAGLRVIANDVNRGRPATRNRLLESARGRLMTWLDADDHKYPGMLQVQLDTLRRIEADEGPHGIDGVFVYTNYDWWWQHSKHPKLMVPEQPDDPMEGLLSSRFGGYLWLMMGTADTFRAAGPFDERLPRLQDLGFFIRFAELGGRFVHVDSDEPFCVYLKDDGGRDALQVWRSWNRIWRRNKMHFQSYGMVNARRWRRHHYRVSRRFARANGDRWAYWYIAVLEVLFIVRGRFRRVLFEA